VDYFRIRPRCGKFEVLCEKQLGRPPKVLDPSKIAGLRSQGLGWRAIATQLGVGVGTLYRAAPGRSKIRETVFGTR
jgi:DNA invertase Pin-like site-specific DNA recombinase